MNDPETVPSNPPGDLPSPAEFRQLRNDFADLRSLVVIALSVVLLLSLVINLHLFREMLTARRDLAAVSERVKPAAERYNREELPMIQALINNLVVFARSNPDFVPILQKHNIGLPKAAPTVQAAPANLPAVPVK